MAFTQTISILHYHLRWSFNSWRFLIISWRLLVLWFKALRLSVLSLLILSTSPCLFSTWLCKSLTKKSCSSLILIRKKKMFRELEEKAFGFIDSLSKFELLGLLSGKVFVVSLHVLKSFTMSSILVLQESVQFSNLMILFISHFVHIFSDFSNLLLIVVLYNKKRFLIS